jgi:DNA polymerase-1
MRIDTKYVKRKQKQTDRKVARLEKELMRTDFMQDWKRLYSAKFNYNSNDQLKYMLFEHKGLEPVKKTAKGHGSVDEESLKQLDLPETNLILRIRKLKKLRSTYLDNFLSQQVNGFMHPFFGLTAAKTFRGNSNEPNFQNIPKRDKEAMKLTRTAIYPREGNQLIEFDFSKLEVSIAACYHKDPVMMKYLTSDHNDMHGDIAAQIFMIADFDKSKYSLLRSAAKNGFVFPQFYGDWFMGNAEALRQWVNLPTGKWKKSYGIGADLPNGKTIAEHLINNGIKEFGTFNRNRSTGFIEHLRQIEDDFWNNRFKAYQQWKQRWVKKYQKRGWFQMHTGFVCRGEMRKNEVINYPVQGAAFHCLLWTLIMMDRYLQENGMHSRVIGQIHDAIVMDIDPDEREQVARKMKEIAEKQLPAAWDWIITPLQIEAEICPVDGSWAEKDDWDWFNKELKI